MRLPYALGSYRGVLASSLSGSLPASPDASPARSAVADFWRCAFNIGMTLNTSPRSALRSLLAATTASADFSLRVPTSPFQAYGEISPDKNNTLPRTTAGSTPLRLDHESFAVYCPLALLGSAFYPVLVHRLAASLRASSPHSVTLMQLRFASLAVICLRRDFHPQECALAGAHKKMAG